MANNYDNAASFYDGLSRLVFGNALIEAQVYLLAYLPANSKVIIIGGGTGRILEEITRLHPSGLHVTYVEVSSRMIALSRKRNTGGNHVLFVNKEIEAVDLTPEYDVVITPFLFDNFTDAGLLKLFAHLHPALKPGGLWFNTDFQLTGQWWQQVLLKSMLLLFKILCGVASWQLPDTGKLFSEQGYKFIKQQTFFKQFVITIMYRK